jgi:hypothetical protein
MASTEWVQEHRELQYLRAAARERPRRKLSRRELRGRRNYAAQRFRKLEEIRRDHGGHASRKRRQPR